jgi:hypothetical protein
MYGGFKMKKGSKTGLLIILLCLTLSTVLAVEKSHDIIVNIPQYVELDLSETSITLGSFMDGTGEIVERLETLEPLVVTYRCNSQNGWSLTVAASNFEHSVDPLKTFPVSYLTWGTDSGAINKPMPLTGEGPAAVVAAGNALGIQNANIYYAVNYPENTYAGDYSSIVTYTLIAH